MGVRVYHRVGRNTGVSVPFWLFLLLVVPFQIVWLATAATVGVLAFLYWLALRAVNALLEAWRRR